MVTAFDQPRSSEYQSREHTTQYSESALAFIKRVAAGEGIWFRFEQTAQREVIERTGRTASSAQRQGGLERGSVGDDRVRRRGESGVEQPRDFQR
ncbi:MULTISPECIES: contractile injection system protein, VgrG/Pvc8 family [unclassified Caballeronia]|uniref:contractile injection system protein, VgrG/Pvc8 family n=1 Tax=unclassified Caballeronia TaxID=2646786 RepID=UPI00285DBA59|nr:MULTISPECIES: contractile injection system protein, VgrG/Pvc8 family [unclassified Caballeronia]MDR5753443.1 contractile injection system protein, VgrG/Pvc8 family [Caballeronia sp. LZ024]MDR5841181.1 contractile injection system protein, VgrG/Pvc8 family [Caballeronia sp. LZ031]